MPEIQYLAYLHNAEDQLRGEAATLQFFSQGRYRNGMVVRIAGYGYQKGFGGHFHNDDSIAVLRDVPGLVVASPVTAGRRCGDAADCVGWPPRSTARVCAFLEPIALYHTRDLFDDGDDLWLARPTTDHVPLGAARTYGDGLDLTVDLGQRLRMSLRVARRLQGRGIQARVVDMRWLTCPSRTSREARRDAAVLVVDDATPGGVPEGVVAMLVDAGLDGQLVARHEQGLVHSPRRRCGARPRLRGQDRGQLPSRSSDRGGEATARVRASAFWLDAGDALPEGRQAHSSQVEDSGSGGRRWRVQRCPDHARWRRH